MTTAAVGIDLGTTYSVIVRIDENGRPEVIPNPEGEKITPSVVQVDVDPPIVGIEAKREAALGNPHTAAFFKRSMGNPQFLLAAGGRDWSAAQLSSLVLSQLKANAEAALGCPVTEAVITVPAYFEEPHRRDTEEAAKLAGLKVLQIINEPTAAAIAYGAAMPGMQGKILVYDLGGGTFDVTLMDITPTELNVIATDGDHNLGGKDWDERIAEWIAERFQEEHNVDLFDDAVASSELLDKAEAVKKALSSRLKDRVSINHGGQRFATELTRAQFDELTSDLMERTTTLCQQVLKSQGIEWQDLDGVLLVGGSTRMPMVGDYVEKMSGKPAMGGVNVDEIVAVGAAIKAAGILVDRGQASQSILSLPGRRKINDVTSHSLGMVAESEDGEKYINSIIITKNKTIPSIEKRPYQLDTRPGNENEMEVFITQGESSRPLECEIIGKYRFTDVSHGDDGLQIIDVSYAYDESGMIKVTACERQTGRNLPLTEEPKPEDLAWLDMPPKKKRTGRGFVSAYLAFDLSGSMSGDPLKNAQQAAREFIEQSDLTTSRIGLIEFADSTRTALEASQSGKDLDEAIGRMKIGPVGYGNAASPFAHTQALLQNETGPKFIIVLTDGIWSYQEQAQQEAKACQQAGIEVIAIGFGYADDNFLKTIATSEKGAFFAANPGELVSTFGTIAREIVESGGGQSASKSLRFIGGS